MDKEEKALYDYAKANNLMKIKKVTTMKESIWNGFKRVDFTFEGMDAIIVFPDDSNKTDKWLFKTEYFNAFPGAEIRMLQEGWHLTYVKNRSRWGLEEDIDRKKRFADFLKEEISLYKKCIPVGMSCGGMIAVYFAAKYPEYVSALYLDAPVMNFLSCPACFGIAKENMMEEFIRDRKMSISELICYRDHPMDKVPLLAENNIPVLLIYGEEDSVVPFCENGKCLVDYYIAHGKMIEAIGKKNCDHHPHGLDDTTPIMDFMMKYKD